MTLREITAQRMAIKSCVALRKSPLETVQMLEVADNMSKVSRAFVYKWHRRFSPERDSIFEDERPSRRQIICKNIVQRISNVMENDGRVTVAELADLFDVSSGTVFTILTDHLEMRRVAARWIPRL